LRVFLFRISFFFFSWIPLGERGDEEQAKDPPPPQFIVSLLHREGLFGHKQIFARVWVGGVQKKSCLGVLLVFCGRLVPDIRGNDTFFLLPSRSIAFFLFELNEALLLNQLTAGQTSFFFPFFLSLFKTGRAIFDGLATSFPSLFPFWKYVRVLPTVARLEIPLLPFFFSLILRPFFFFLKKDGLSDRIGDIPP